MSARKPQWRENRSGTCPPSLRGKGKRCRVRLRNGREPAEAWDAGTTRWSLTPESPSGGFDVVAYMAESE